MTQETHDLALLSATELSALFRARKASPVEATRAVLAQIDALNPVINAFCWLDPEQALASARASEDRWQRGEPKSPLDGVTATVKGPPVTRGWPTRRGSRAIARATVAEDLPGRPHARGRRSCADHGAEFGAY